MQASGMSARERLPSQRRDRSGLAPDSLAARRFVRGDYHRRAMVRSRALTVWLPVLAWAAVIFTLSSVPSLSTGLGLWDTILRKGAHITEYAVLGALLYRALGREAPAPVYFRRDADVTAALRRLNDRGARVAVFTAVPEELARVALAHLGGAQRVEALEAGEGAQERAVARLGGAATLVHTRDELIA